MLSKNSLNLDVDLVFSPCPRIESDVILQQHHQQAKNKGLAMMNENKLDLLEHKNLQIGLIWFEPTPN